MEKYSEVERLAYAKSAKWEYPKDEIDPDTNIAHTAVIGDNGFGFARDVDGSLVPIPHAGNVVIKAMVVVGHNTCIDRAVNGSTIIGKGTKIDNLVHIGHGAHIGEHCLLVAGSVIGGSARIGSRVFIGMGALIKNKITIGDDVTIGMGSVVTKDVPSGETWVGNPARKLEK